MVPVEFCLVVEGVHQMLKSDIEIFLSFQRISKLYQDDLFPDEKICLSEAIDSFEKWSLSELVYYLDEVVKEKQKLNWEFRRSKRLEKLTPLEKKHYYRHYLDIIEEIGRKELRIFENTLNSLGVKLSPGNRILEVGCGRGGFMSQFMEAYQNEIIGVDMDTSSLLISHKINRIPGNERYELFAQFGDNLPFEDESFDFVVSFSTLEHVGDFNAKQKFVTELRRVCRRSGLIVMEFPNRFNIFTPEEHVGLRFLGFLPGTLRQRYSLLFKGMPIKDIELPGFTQIRRLLSSICPTREEYMIFSTHHFTKSIIKSLILNNSLGRFLGPGFIVTIDKSKDA